MTYEMYELLAAVFIAGLFARGGIDWLAGRWVDYTDRRKHCVHSAGVNDGKT